VGQSSFSDSDSEDDDCTEDEDFDDYTEDEKFSALYERAREKAIRIVFGPYPNPVYAKKITYFAYITDIIAKTSAPTWQPVRLNSLTVRPFFTF